MWQTILQMSRDQLPITIEENIFRCYQSQLSSVVIDLEFISSSNFIQICTKLLLF